MGDIRAGRGSLIHDDRKITEHMCTLQHGVFLVAITNDALTKYKYEMTRMI